MSKMKYDGLNAEFVPFNGADVVTQSPGTCYVISVQYYVGEEGWSECNTDEGDGDGEGYSYNYNRRPTGA